mmetsp:Transcript_6149/g.17194  ORF Transcript_6149/g.17194 Transcript_6149/m.17194 type:complete len:270 (-) Transcript_6149:7-816(-)
MVQLLVDDLALAFSTALHLELGVAQLLEQGFRARAALAELGDPSVEGVLRGDEGLVHWRLIVALVLPEDEAMRADGLPAVEAVEAQLLVAVLVAEHAAAVVVEADARGAHAAEIHDIVALEETLGVGGALASVAEHAVALDAAARGGLLLAKPTDRRRPRRAALAVARRRLLLLLPPNVHHELQDSVYAEVAARGQHRAVAADRALQLAPLGMLLHVGLAEVVRALQHDRIIEEVITHWTAQFALHRGHGQRSRALAVRAGAKRGGYAS